MPVHYAGFPCRLDELVELARKHGFAVVEDAAHAFGSTYKDRMIGSVGDLTCFSFDPVKNITCGEGGAVTTNNDELARGFGCGGTSASPRLWSRRDETRPWYYEASAPGLRSHLPGHQRCDWDGAARHVRRERARKRELLQRYLDGLADVTGVSPGRRRGRNGISVPLRCPRYRRPP